MDDAATNGELASIAMWVVLGIVWIVVAGMIGVWLGHGQNRALCFGLSACLPALGWIIAAMIGNSDTPVGDRHTPATSAAIDLHDRAVRELMARLKPQKHLVVHPVVTRKAARKSRPASIPPASISCPYCASALDAAGLSAGHVYTCPVCSREFATS